jgi:DNA invertase Pin-like site-specific DNA recombinase
MGANVRAAIYARLSADRDGSGLAVERQQEDCEKLCDERGWDVVAVLIDNDMSATSGKRRPGFD